VPNVEIFLALNVEIEEHTKFASQGVYALIPYEVISNSIVTM
jgi:hypothetical protein